jgi:DNA-binding MarR family transcriptional regulator
MSASTQAPDSGALDVEPLAGGLYAVVVYLHKHCNADLFEALGTLELTLTQTKLLHHLDEASAALPLGRAAELVHVSLPAASRMVDDLVRRGFVDRYEDPADRRMKRIQATEKGGAAVRRLNAARLQGLRGFVESLTDTERARFGTALSTLLERPDVAACRPEGPDQ